MATQVFQSLLMWVRSNLSLWMMVIKCIVVKFMPTFNFRLQGPSVQPILKTSSLFYRTFTESTQDHQYLAWEFLWEGKAFLITVKPPVSNHPKCEELVAAYRRLCLRESNHRGSLPRRSPNPTPFLERMYCMRFLGYNTSNNKLKVIDCGWQWLKVKTLLLQSCAFHKFYMTDSQNACDQITGDRSSKRVCSYGVLCIPFIFSGSPSKCNNNLEIRIGGSSCHPQ